MHAPLAVFALLALVRPAAEDLAVRAKVPAPAVVGPAGEEVADTVAGDGETGEERPPRLSAPDPGDEVRFDAEDVLALPVSDHRDVWMLATLAPFVTTPAPFQPATARGPAFAAGGLTPRSNNFTIDGFDVNDPAAGGRQLPIQHPDAVAELEVHLAPLSAEHGRGAGATVNLVTRRGTDRFSGSAFWLGNRNEWNARTNLDEAAGLSAPPHLSTDKWGGALRGPIVRGRTFFSVSYQRWTDRTEGATRIISGVPTAAGRRVLETAAGHLPQVGALLRFLPEADTGTGRSANFTLDGRRHAVPLGSLLGWADLYYESHQGLARLDHSFDADNTLTLRYLVNDDEGGGWGQVAPRWMFTNDHTRQQSAAAWLTSRLSGTLTNEFRVGFSRFGLESTARARESADIPSLEVAELGLTGWLASPARTGVGLPADLPRSRKNDVVQVQEVLTAATARHTLRLGFDVRRSGLHSSYNPLTRGRVAYRTLQDLVDDVADSAAITRPLPGGSDLVDFDWSDLYLFAHETWRAHQSLTLEAGLRYERPGHWMAGLLDLNGNVVEAAGGDPRFALPPSRPEVPNLQPRAAVAWSPDPRWAARAAYARAYDYAFLDLALDLSASFPQVATVVWDGPVAGAWGLLPAAAPALADPDVVPRTLVAEDLRAPFADQWSLSVERALGDAARLRVGYVGSRGYDLFHAVSDGHLTWRRNGGRSWYDGVEASLDGRRGPVRGALHYTWSRHFDTASDVFEPLPGPPVRARSAWDRPHRAAGHLTWEARRAGHRLLGGWRVSAIGTAQSGAPFTPHGAAHPSSRNSQRTAPLFRLDVALSKDTRIAGGHVLQLRLDAWNATNTRQFGIPAERADRKGVFDVAATDGGSRRVWASVRYAF